MTINGKFYAHALSFSYYIAGAGTVRGRGGDGDEFLSSCRHSVFRRLRGQYTSGQKHPRTTDARKAGFHPTQ